MITMMEISKMENGKNYNYIAIDSLFKINMYFNEYKV